MFGSGAHNGRPGTHFKWPSESQDSVRSISRWITAIVVYRLLHHYKIFRPKLLGYPSLLYRHRFQKRFHSIKVLIGNFSFCTHITCDRTRCDARRQIYLTVLVSSPKYNRVCRVFILKACVKNSFRSRDERTD